MTKGTTRRERKYRKKAVSVCKITSTSSNSGAAKNAVNHRHHHPPPQEHGHLVTTALTQSAATGGGASLSSVSQTSHSAALQSSTQKVRQPSRRSLVASMRSSSPHLIRRVFQRRPQISSLHFLKHLGSIYRRKSTLLDLWTISIFFNYSPRSSTRSSSFSSIGRRQCQVRCILSLYRRSHPSTRWIRLHRKLDTRSTSHHHRAELAGHASARSDRTIARTIGRDTLLCSRSHHLSVSER